MTTALQAGSGNYGIGQRALAGGYLISLRRIGAWLTALALCVGAGVAVAAGDATVPRVVSTDAAATQILFGLGLDAALVGVDVTSTLPEGYRELPDVGYHRALSAEGLLALAPTLVIGSVHIGPPAVLRTLAAAKVQVLRLPAARSVAEVQANVGAVATAMGAPAQGAAMNERLAQQDAALGADGLEEQSALFVLSLDAGKLQVAGSDTAGDAFIRLLGARNGADFTGYRTLSAEAVMAIDPHIILVGSREQASPGRLLELNPILRHGQAARADHVLAVDAANLVAGLSPGAVAEAVTLTEQLRAATTVAAKP